MSIVLILAFVFIGVFAAAAISSREQKKKENAITAALKKVGRDFEDMGWNNWSYAIHMLPEQGDRIGRALNTKSMKILRVDKASATAAVQGESGKVYDISPQGCTCPDFQARGMPCKHMYYVVMHADDYMKQS